MAAASLLLLWKSVVPVLTLLQTTTEGGRPPPIRLSRFNMPSLDTADSSVSKAPANFEFDENAVVRSKCQCGKVKLSVPARALLPLEYGDSYKAAVDCHCPSCRKYHVAAFCSYLLAPNSDVDITDKSGSLQTYRDACRQLGPVVRLQCGTCRSKLATRPLRVEARFGHQLLLNMGAIDDRTLPKPMAQFFCQNKNRMQWQWDQRARWTAGMANADLENSVGHHKPMTLTGSCTCGQCKYRIRLEGSTELQHCYCRLCRRVSGSPFQTWVPFHRDDFSWVVNLEDAEGVATQRPPLQKYVPHGRRHVCPNCGGVLTIVYQGQEDTVWPAAGGFDDASLPASTLQVSQRLHSVMHISCRYKQSWYAIPDDGNERIPEAG